MEKRKTYVLLKTFVTTEKVLMDVGDISRVKALSKIYGTICVFPDHLANFKRLHLFSAKSLSYSWVT